MSQKFTNTLTRRREEFVPLNPPRVGMYVCGPTVYGHSHLGHAKSYLSFDVIVRWLRASGYEVNYVQNITDVGHLTDDADEGEDKIVVEARKRGLHPMAVVETFIRSYLEDMDALNILRADIMPRATGHIPEQIAMIQCLIARGHAYENNGSVYFSVASFPGYGKLAGRKVEELEAGARVEVSEEKRHPADFALWKRAEPTHIMRWPSPWGDGFPGWHIECSAMSRKYLGDTLDIHGGGMENKFPHHECEIAQSECATGRPFVRFWLHNNMVTLNGQKMGKSLGNAISLKDVFYGRPEGVRDRNGALLLDRTYEPAVVRHFVLTSHYGAPLDFSADALHGAESGSFKLRDALAAVADAAARAPVDRPPRDAVRAALAEFDVRATAAMHEDINTAAVIAGLFDLTRQSGEWLRAGDVGRADFAAALSTLHRWTSDILGFAWRSGQASDNGRADAVIKILADLRLEARRDKNFALGDEIRKRLAAAGVELRDTPQGTTW
ncbi:MAG: cysteine--tRNA ligase [Phycisphaerales bacterium]|nr:cysteine--tRNA ligase [Phycisphaerales bacterium]